MPQNQNKPVRYLQWVARNLNHFEFLSTDALQLRDEVRRWYYGGQDPTVATRLARSFNKMFSANVLQDALSMPLRELQCQTHQPVDPASPLGSFTHTEVIGQTIRVYGGPQDTWRDQEKMWQLLKKEQENAEKRLPVALRELRTDIAAARSGWARLGMSFLGILSTLLLLAVGLLMLMQSVTFLSTVVQAGGVGAAVAQMPAAALGISVKRRSISCLLCVVGAVVFLLVLQRALFRLRAGLVWLLRLRGNYRRWLRVCDALDAGVRKEGLKLYTGKVQYAVRTLCKNPDSIENEDPTRKVLATSCLNQMFTNTKVPPVPQEPAGMGMMLSELRLQSLPSPKLLIVLVLAALIACAPALMNARAVDGVLELQADRRQARIGYFLSDGGPDGEYAALTPVSASSSALYIDGTQSYSLMALQDDSNSTYWASAESPAWIRYDMGSACTVWGMSLSLGENDEGRPHNITVTLLCDGKKTFSRSVRLNAKTDGPQTMVLSEGVTADTVQVELGDVSDGDAVYLSQLSVLG